MPWASRGLEVVRPKELGSCTVGWEMGTATTMHQGLCSCSWVLATLELCSSWMIPKEGWEQVAGGSQIAFSLEKLSHVGIHRL